MAKISSVGAAAGCFLTAGFAVAEGLAIDTPAELDQHYEEASKNFGNGVVQLHSSQKGGNGIVHSVHQFDCVNKNYEAIFAGGMAPEEFPMGTTGAAPSPIYKDSEIAPLAQHACTKYGHPLLEW